MSHGTVRDSKSLAVRKCVLDSTDACRGYNNTPCDNIRTLLWSGTATLQLVLQSNIQTRLKERLLEFEVFSGKRIGCINLNFL